MKSINKVIITFVFTALIFAASITGCGGENDVVIKKDTVLIVDTIKQPLVIEKQEIKQPEYVPPQNGKSNKKWFGNRNRQLMNDRDCYFGKGMQKRHRYRGGRNN